MIPQGVKKIMRVLQAAGHQAYLVGGCVRDMLRGAPPQDWDMTTSARPEQVQQLFGENAIPTGLQHGTVTVRQDGICCEVTTFRCDGPYADGRHPVQVTFSDSLEEDLARRDLTINAMAMDAAGGVVDLFGGREDLRQGVIRCVGQPQKRFDEDALRILRAMRFASQLNFSIEERTDAAIRTCGEHLAHIAPERIREEMEKLLLGPGASEILMAYPLVLGVFLPEATACVGFEQKNPHHLYDVWEHTARAVGAAPQDAVIRWAMLLHDLGKPDAFTVDEAGTGHFYGHAEISAQMVGEITARLRFDKKTAARVETLVAQHGREIASTEKAVGRALRMLGEEALRQLLAVKRADAAACHPDYARRTEHIDAVEAVLENLLAKNACFTLRDLAVNGYDLQSMGLQGREIGILLEELLEQVIDGQLPNQREELLQWAGSRR